MQCFGDFRPNFVAGIGEEVLRGLNTTKEFVQVVTKFNEFYCKKARELRIIKTEHLRQSKLQMSIKKSWTTQCNPSIGLAPLNTNAETTPLYVSMNTQMRTIQPMLQILATKIRMMIVMKPT